MSTFTTKLFEQEKDEKWFRSIADRYIPSFNKTWREDFNEKAKLFKFFNNDIADYLPVLNKMCNDVVSQGAADDLLLHYNKIRNKFDVLSGDLLRRGNNHKIVLLSAKAVKNKNEKMLERLQESVEKDLQLVLKRAVEELKSMNPKELEDFITQERQMLTPKDINYKNFLSDVEIYKNKMLRHTYIDQEVMKKQIETFKHMFIASEFYIYTGWQHGKPYFEVLNPLYCNFHKSGNKSYAQDADWFTYSDEISIGQCLDEYINVLSEEELEKVMKYSKFYNGLNKDQMDKFVFDHVKTMATINLTQGRGSSFNFLGLSEGEPNSRLFFNERIRRTHLEFKAYKECIFYTYKDEYGDSITVILPNNASIIPENAQKLKYTNEWFEEDTKWVWTDEDGNEHQVEIKWIPRRYELTRLGEDIYIQMREVPFQPDNIRNPISAFELSYKGGMFFNTNSKATSLMQNAMPYQMQIIAAKALQNKEMAKYRGFEVVQDISRVPKDLAGNSENSNDIITNVEVIAKKTGTRWTDSSSSMNGLPNPQAGTPVYAMQLGSSAELVNFNMFIESLDVELGLACGVSKPREGQMVGANVTDNQQSIMQTSLQTEPYFFEHSKVWNSVLNEHLRNIDTYYKNWFEKHPDDKETLIEYITPDGTADLINVIPEYLSHSDIGLFLGDGYSDKTYREAMIQKIMQNTANISIDQSSAILKSISMGASAEEIHREIQMYAEDVRKKEEGRQNAEMQMQQELKKSQFEAMKYKSDLDLEADVIKERERRETNLGVAVIEADRFRLQQDVNKNNVADDVEKMREEYGYKKEMQQEEIEGKKEIAKISKKNESQ